MLVETGKQPGVELLDLFMALLIEGINGTFTLGDETLRGPWPAYTVFDMPQAKIAQMQSLRPDESLGWQGEGGCWLLCPYAVSDLYSGTTSTTVRSSLGNSAWTCTRSSWRLLQGALGLSVMRCLSLACILTTMSPAPNWRGS